MQLSITDGVTERLSLLLEQLGKHLWDATDPTETDGFPRRALLRWE